MTSLSDTAAVTGRAFSILGLFQHADSVVKSILIGLLIASIICWALIFEKIYRVWRLNREVGDLEAVAAAGILTSSNTGGLLNSISTAAQAEWDEGAGGLEMLRRVLQQDAKAKVIVFTTNSEPVYAAHAMRAGARGYVSKSAPADELLAAVRKVYEGG